MLDAAGVTKAGATALKRPLVLVELVEIGGIHHGELALAQRNVLDLGAGRLRQSCRFDAHTGLMPGLEVPATLARVDLADLARGPGVIQAQRQDQLRLHHVPHAVEPALDRIEGWAALAMMIPPNL